MSLLDDFKARFANDENLDLTEIENNWQAYDPVWQCYYCVEYGVNACQDEAIYQLIAHMSASEESDTGAPIKGVQSKSWGSESVTYGQVNNTGEYYSWLNSTKYGQRFYILTLSNQGGFFV